jgi:hypothetical protein
MASVRAQLNKLESERATMQAALGGAQEECGLHEKMFSNLAGFGDSFVSLQSSQAAAAQSLKEEKMHAIEAATVSVNNREAVMNIASSLESLSGDTLQTSQNVQGLTERAAQIGRSCSSSKKLPIRPTCWH